MAQILTLCVVVCLVRMTLEGEGGSVVPSTFGDALLCPVFRAHILVYRAQNGVRRHRASQPGFHTRSPNVAIEWILLLRMRQVPGSYLGPDTGYPDGGFTWFSLVRLGECQDSTYKLGHNRFLSNPFWFIIHLYSLIRRYAVVFGCQKSAVK
jgi:hypothetical protein